MFKVFIDGQEGTTGLKIAERLAKRSDISLLEIAQEKRKDVLERKNLISQSDITFLCLPDDAAKQSVELAKDTNARVIDASTAHRVLDNWVYGMPELPNNLQKIKTAKYVAVPGCHANGAISLIRPLIESKVINKNFNFIINSITGYSGGGKKMIAEYQNVDRDKQLESPRHYALLQEHKHLPEIQKYASLANAPLFIPTVSNFYSGMCVTIPMFSGNFDKKVTKSDLINLYTKYYATHNMVDVVNFEQPFLASNLLSGYDNMKIIISGSEDKFILSAVYDNLGRGASGAAINCMNIMLGIDSQKSLNIYK